jgi:hypothetical protein
MRTKVTELGVLIPKLLLEGIDEVEIRQEQNVIVVVPVTADDLIPGLGKQPITLDVEDVSVNHDGYLSGR